MHSLTNLHTYTLGECFQYGGTVRIITQLPGGAACPFRFAQLLLFILYYSYL